MTLHRRDILRGAYALTLAQVGFQVPSLAKSILPRQDNSLAPFILVHGAFHGGWCWSDVAQQLRATGHPVYTPTLAGLGTRANESQSDITLETHIEDLERLIRHQDLTDIILVSHSYGGIVATGVVDRLRSRMRHIIYVDAYVPVDGGSFIDARLDRTDAEMALDKGLALNAVDGRIPPFPPEVFGIPRKHPKYAFVKNNITPHPAQTWLDQVRLVNGGIAGFPKTYIQCTQPKLGDGLFEKYASLARTTHEWDYKEIATGHDAMITAPDVLSQLLLESVQLRSIQHRG